MLLWSLFYDLIQFLRWYFALIGVIISIKTSFKSCIQRPCHLQSNSESYRNRITDSLWFGLNHSQRAILLQAPMWKLSIKSKIYSCFSVVKRLKTQTSILYFNTKQIYDRRYVLKCCLWLKNKVCFGKPNFCSYLKQNSLIYPVNRISVSKKKKKEVFSCLF